MSAARPAAVLRPAARTLAPAVAVLLLQAAAAADEPRLVVYRWQQGAALPPADGPTGSLPVGSLAKPFVAQAWARAHPGQAPPAVRCTPASRCWNASGHGTLGLVRATAVSCNTYFRALAAETPTRALADALQHAGWQAPDPLTPEMAIGLPGGAGRVSAEPSSVLRAYAGLLREPWPRAESVRHQVLAGLREGTRGGTASGLGLAGFLAKTGTVPSLDGAALSTSGWAVAMDGSERGFLALLTPGTGRQAASALGRWLRAGSPRPGADRRDGEALRGAARSGARSHGLGLAPGDRVGIVMFGPLAPRRASARNLGPAPIATSRGFVGPGGALELRPADRLGEGLWELRLPASGLVRRLRARVRVDADPRDVLRIVAEADAREYVSGVIAAELAADDRALRTALGAAVLRFLREGPRHGDADRCDLTHCAFFVGRGPRLEWRAGGRALLARPDAREDAAAADPLDPAVWAQMRALSDQPGPARWTSHCGGQPMSARALWGAGDERVYACGRHASRDDARWERRWTRSEVALAFGAEVEDLSVVSPDGQWRLELRAGDERRLLSWDVAHARLAGVLGWGALPSPADHVRREGDSYRASGRGLGHRVGLCLAASGAELD